MDQYKTNNKLLNSILDPVVLNLQKSNFDVHQNAFEAVPNKINDIKASLKINDTIISVNLFLETYSNIKVSKKPTPIEWRKFLMNLHNALLEIDNFITNNILQSIFQCETQLENLENTASEKYILSWFKSFCKNICVCLTLIHKRTKESTSEDISNHLFLYIVQLTTCTKLMSILFIEEISNNMLITESRRFLKKRYIYIFDGIKKILTDNNCPEQNPGFIQWMDNALDLISELDPNKNDPQYTENIKTNVEEVLCHAMSIAQICSEDDCKKIKASVQTVLHEFKQLESEFNKSVVNPSFANLYIDLVSDKLCILEKRVNTAVLNISLKVFSDPLVLLKTLQNMCEESDTSILTRSENDLDEPIQNFDVHVDCMIQVGLFAIACSTNTKIIAKIRSYLASLESLECELIPALTSLYMEPSKSSCLYANLFIQHWCEEVNLLRNDVCFIIDPVAFGQVVHDEFKIKLEDMQQLMLNSAEVLKKDMITSLSKNVKVFILVVGASMKDMEILNESSINKHIKNLKDESESTRETKNNKLNFTEIVNNISLKSLQERGLEILKDRSVLYKTPNLTNTKLLSAMTPRGVTSTKKQGNRKLGMSFLRKNILSNCDDEEDNETMDLQITEILEELTNLADTLK